MKIATGYICISLLISVFALLFSGFMGEAGELKTLNGILDDEIDVDSSAMPSNSYLYDKNGEIFSEIHYEQNRRYLSFERIPHTVINAFLSTEDQHFYEHEGVDASAIARALMVNASSGEIEEGASTITQQVARNLYLSNERSYNRKLSELLHSYQLEKEFSKKEILEMYVNSIYFHNGVYGFETASVYYFGKTAVELSLGEIAFLAAIPANPSHYDPLLNKENTTERQEWILLKMEETNTITEKEKYSALQETIELQVSEMPDLYPDYAHFIEAELKQLIASEEGYTEQLVNAEEDARSEISAALEEKTREVLASGIHIETYLYPEAQEKVIQQTTDTLHQFQLQGASVVINHAAGRVAAVSGGAGYEKYEFHRAFQAYRQPGSAIKPLLVFGPYLNEFEASIADKISTDKFCSSSYCPSNAGGVTYGNVDLSSAFANSYNTAAVRLLDKTGIDTSFSYLDRFDFSAVTAQDHSYPAALGGFSEGVTPLELTKAYTVFSNNGVYIPPRGIKKVTDTDGNVLYEWKNTSSAVWTEETNNKLRIMLTTVMTEGTGKAGYLNESAGGKTGTTNDYQDLWFVGFNDRYTTGIWLGQDQPASIQEQSGRQPHLKLWKSIMEDLP
ncbi:transglycosylase domain-containing protein [Alteribacillus sp. HJP-4]|uniref:transglycosylase domain-containing protein n=1 Tax=Alteribacillus sp. HJP-4 TaxID=2775394 RepID=UPI0035CD0910